MGKIFPDGKAHFDPVTHKILKPDNWEEKYAPEPAIKRNCSASSRLTNAIKREINRKQKGARGSFSLDYKVFLVLSQPANRP